MRFSRGLTLAVALAMAALTTVPGYGMPNYQTKMSLHEINKMTGVVGGAVESKTWPLNRAGVSFARPFQVGDQSFLFLLRQHSGEASISHLGADGKIGAVVEVRNLGQGWTSADFIRGVGTVLVLNNAFTGQVRSFRMQANGRLNAAPEADFTLTSLQDQLLFSPYLLNGKWRLFSLDPWTGKALSSSDSWTQMTETEWTRGWTSLDHLTIAGSTYRLLYKAAGDPHETDAQEAGRLVIQKVGAGAPQNIFDVQVEPGWSSVRFVPSTGEPVSATRILFYRNDTGEYAVRSFNPLTGIGAVSVQKKIDPGATDVRVFLAGTRIFLTALNEENATPFTAEQAETMGLTIHKGLKNKAVGYQFLLLQSGKVLYSRAWGHTRLEPSPVEMTSRTRLDLGSVGKMITTMTTLKLADQGKVFLNQSIASQVDPDKYPAATLNSWIKDRNLIDLMKQTTGLEGTGENASPNCIGDDATFKVTCKKFFDADPTLTCAGGLCPRSYNNANFGALRQVIENESGTDTTADLVEYTQDLWARGIGLGGANAVSCSAPAETFDFERCAGAEDCVLADGVWWRQEEHDRPYSSSCGAGGWHASSRQMGEFMAAARYGKVLSDNVNDLWMSTEHTALVDGSPKAGATALGWEPAWSAGGEKLLQKNGARVGVTYVTQLPNRMDAVVIVNTGLDNHPQGLLKDAYLFAADPKSDPPIYVEIFKDGSADAGAVSQVAVNKISNAGGGQHATAVRDGSGNLLVIGWNVMAGGKIVREKTIEAGAVSEVAITDGEGFVTAVRNGSGDLQVTAWSTSLGVAKNIARKGSAVAGAASKVSAARLAGSGSLDGRVATAVRNGEGNLQIDVWDFHNAAEEVTRRDTAATGLVTEVAVRTLRDDSSLAKPTRLVTAVRNGEGKLQVDVWDVSGAGKLTRRGKAVAEGVSAAASTHKIAIGRWDDDDFFTASINEDGKLDVIRWTVSETGELTRGAQGGTGGEVTEVAAAGGATAVRVKDGGDLKLINWRIVADKLVRYGEASAGEVKQVAAAGRVLTASQLADGTLHLNHWSIVD